MLVKLPGGRCSHTWPQLPSFQAPPINKALVPPASALACTPLESSKRGDVAAVVVPSLTSEQLSPLGQTDAVHCCFPVTVPGTRTAQMRQNRKSSEAVMVARFAHGRPPSCPDCCGLLHVCPGSLTSEVPPEPESTSGGDGPAARRRVAS
jgi:hypothetical protein